MKIMKSKWLNKYIIKKNKQKIKENIDLCLKFMILSIVNYKNIKTKTT